jgi:phosphoenolpyruvate phosphomutase
VDVFCEKLRRGKEAQIGEEFMIFARIEALIAGLGVEEALMRAQRYVVDGKADGILIHSKEKTGEDVFEFMRKFRQDFPRIPVIAVPTTYNGFTEEQLFAQGIDIVIYANHLLRAAYPAMLQACESILDHGRSKELDKSIMNIKDIINLIPQ